MTTSFNTPRQEPSVRSDKDKEAAASKKKFQPKIVSFTIACTGGACMQCGLSLTFWFNYQLCNKCLEIPSNAVIKT